MKTSATGNQGWLDGLAIGGSLACMIHCLLLPVVLALLPAASQWLSLPDNLHLWILLAAIPFSTYVLWRHSLRRGIRRPFVLGMVGLSVMAVALLFEGKAIEPLIASVGSAALAAAHWLNWRGRRN